MKGLPGGATSLHPCPDGAPGVAEGTVGDGSAGVAPGLGNVEAGGELTGELPLAVWEGTEG